MCTHRFSPNDTGYRVIVLAVSIRHDQFRFSIPAVGQYFSRTTSRKQSYGLLYKSTDRPTGGMILPAPSLATLFQSNMRLLVASWALLAALSAFAAPADPEKRQIHNISSRAVSAFKPYSFYAASAYCKPSVLQTWTCGGARRSPYHGSLCSQRHSHHRQLQSQPWLPSHRVWRRRRTRAILYVFTGKPYA